MRVAITGSSGFIGSRLVDHLSRDASVEKIVGLDVVPPRETSAKLSFVKQDVTQPMDRVFQEHGVDAAMHLAFVLDPMHDQARETSINVVGTENFARACEASGVKTVVLASSGTAYGAHPDNPVPLREEHPLRGNANYIYSRDKVKQEEILAGFAQRNPEARVAVLRPAVVLGPHVSNFMSRMVRHGTVYASSAENPPWQFVHEEDTGRAFAHALLQRAHGAFNVGAEGALTLDEIGRLAGAKVVKLWPWALKAATSLGWMLRMTSLTEAPAGVLSFLRFPWVVDPSKFVRETGFRYEHDSRGALMSFLESAGLAERGRQKEGKVAVGA